MKQLITLLLLIFLVGCHKNADIGPADLLYQRWHIFQSHQSDDSTWRMYNTDAYYDTEYKPDGTLIYRRDGVITPTPCCQGNRYGRDGILLKYSDYSICPTALCLSINEATIRVLRDDLLELQQGNTITQYTPVR